MIEPQGIGYITLVTVLQRVQELLGIQRVASIIRQYHTAATLKGLPPSKWPRVIAHCHFAIAGAKSWEWMLSAKEYTKTSDFRPGAASSRFKVAQFRTKLFNEAVDKWFESCEYELKLTRPDLYDEPDRIGPEAPTKGKMK